MMNQLSQPIADFIRQYGLEENESGVCFDANLLLFTQTQFARVPAEVHIRRFGAGVATIDLLNTSLGIDHFPSHFELGMVEMIHKAGKGLVLRGNVPQFGSFRMLLQPVNQRCDEATRQEIHAKLNN